MSVTYLYLILLQKITFMNMMITDITQGNIKLLVFSLLVTTKWGAVGLNNVFLLGTWFVQQTACSGHQTLPLSLLLLMTTFI